MTSLTTSYPIQACLYGRRTLWSRNMSFCMLTALYNRRSLSFCITGECPIFCLFSGSLLYLCLHHKYSLLTLSSLRKCLYFPLWSSALDVTRCLSLFIILWCCCIGNLWIGLHCQSAALLLKLIHQMFVKIEQYWAPLREDVGQKSLKIGVHALWEGVPAWQCITQTISRTMCITHQTKKTIQKLTVLHRKYR